MYPSYYALRRINPYRGVVHFVDIGEATAHTFDGLTWHLRADDGYGWVRPVGVWVEGAGLKLGQPQGLEDLIAALEYRPPLPFFMQDTDELWLLDGESGLPLALLAAQRSGGVLSAEPVGAEWHPFVSSYTGFHSSALAEVEPVMSRSGDTHRDILARVVNQAAHSEAVRSNPMTQWFQRGQDGVGKGRTGLSLPHEWHDREMAAANFPELLVREAGSNRSAISDYHRWLAPLLLLWPRLSLETRSRLEVDACEKPQWLARIHRLLPIMVNPDRIRAALVAARLEQAQGGTDNDWIDR